MQTRIEARHLQAPAGVEADRILRSCVHCGFCLSACPTYRLLGNESDSPRGRIYLIKQLLEGANASDLTRLHLDRCLTCLACESVCPSGVNYHRLVSTGRLLVEQQTRRSLRERILRVLLRLVLPYSYRVRLLLQPVKWLRPILPAALRRRIPENLAAGEWPPKRHKRTMLALAGCVQTAARPRIDAAAARVLDRLGISLITVKDSGCCGALSYHLNAHAEAEAFMRRNIDAWWPHIEQGAEAIVITASGCGVQVKDYSKLLAHDPGYAEKAARVAGLARDLCEVLEREDLDPLRKSEAGATRLAFHSPCSLQHGQRLDGKTEQVLRRLGYEPGFVPDRQICCGSAGSYSLLQPEISQRLLQDKIAALEKSRPDLIATANIGCLLHLQSATTIPVIHWIELLDPLRH